MENLRIEFTDICKGCEYADIKIARNVYDLEKSKYSVECAHESACKAAVDRERQRCAERREAIVHMQKEEKSETGKGNL